MAGRLDRGRNTGGVPCRVVAGWQDRRSNSARAPQLEGSILQLRFGSAPRANLAGTNVQSSSPDPAAQASDLRRKCRRLFVTQNWPPVSLQERALKVKLKVRRRTDALGEKTPQMFCGLEQRIRLRTDWNLLLPAQQGTHLRQSRFESVQQVVKSF
jgi:hypothetical protein